MRTTNLTPALRMKQASRRHRREPPVERSLTLWQVASMAHLPGVKAKAGRGMVHSRNGQQEGATA